MTKTLKRALVCEANRRGVTVAELMISLGWGGIHA